jgi:hypothetical protein
VKLLGSERSRELAVQATVTKLYVERSLAERALLVRQNTDVRRSR